MSEQVMSVDAPLIHLEDTSPRGQITVKGDLSSPDLQTALREVTGAEVPGALAQSAGRIVWMAPDELLVLVPDVEVPDAVRVLEEGTAGQHVMVLDVSDARAILRVSGRRAGEVLAKGAPCDCSDHGFPPGTARRTHLGGLAVGIWRLDEENWEIVCFRSYAHHLSAWLEQCAAAGSEVWA